MKEISDIAYYELPEKEQDKWQCVQQIKIHKNSE